MFSFSNLIISVLFGSVRCLNGIPSDVTQYALHDRSTFICISFLNLNLNICFSFFRFSCEQELNKRYEELSSQANQSQSQNVLNFL